MGEQADGMEAIRNSVAGKDYRYKILILGSLDVEPRRGGTTPDLAAPTSTLVV